MRICIAYYSLTGNTETCSRNLEKLLKDMGHDITCNKVENIADVEEYDMVVIGFPVHCLNMPKKVKEFLNRIELREKPTYLFCTYALFGSARALSMAKEIVKRRGGKLMGQSAIKARPSLLIFLGLKPSVSMHQLSLFLEDIKRKLHTVS